MPDEHETTISADSKLVTLINVFTCPESRQHELVAALNEATVEIMMHLPGFISANIHASLDQTRVVNYAQWATMEDFDDMRNNKKVQAHMAQVMTIAESADPRFFTVRATHHS